MWKNNLVTKVIAWYLNQLIKFDLILLQKQKNQNKSKFLLFVQIIGPVVVMSIKWSQKNKLLLWNHMKKISPFSALFGSLSSFDFNFLHIYEFLATSRYEKYHHSIIFKTSFGYIQIQINDIQWNLEFGCHKYLFVIFFPGERLIRQIKVSKWGMISRTVPMYQTVPHQNLVF